MLTYSDAIDHLVDYLGGSDEDREQRKLRRAIQMAYKNLLQIYAWSYTLKKTRIRFEEPYSQGTCAYTHSTRVLTVSGNSDNLPSWTADGTVDIGGVLHEVDSRESNTTLKLNAVNNPGADVSSGTSYTLFKSVYLLPEDFTAMLRPIGENDGFYNCWVPPEEWLGLERTLRASGKPYIWTILGDSGINRIGRHSIHVWPRPTTTETMDFLYRRRPRRMRRTGTSETGSYTGTVSGTAGDNPTLTFSGETLHASMAGCVIRLTDATDAPPDGDGSLKPFLEEFVISSVVPASHTCVISGTMANTYASNTFRISDPVDIDPELYEPFFRGCEWQLSILNRDPSNVIALARDSYRAAVRQALEAEARHPANATVLYATANPLDAGNYSISMDQQ